MDESSAYDQPRFPQPEDILFKEGANLREFACPKYFPSMEKLCTGYADAAKMILTDVFAGDMHPDQYFYPVAFLYRHALELRLKDMISEGRRFLGVADDGHPQHHNLTDLWSEVSKLISKIWPHRQGVESVGRNIGSLSEVDPFATDFRYLKRRNRSPAFEDLSIHNIDLRNFGLVMDRILTYLYCLSAELDDMPTIENEPKAT